MIMIDLLWQHAILDEHSELKSFHFSYNYWKYSKEILAVYEAFYLDIPVDQVSYGKSLFVCSYFFKFLLNRKHLSSEWQINKVFF